MGPRAFVLTRRCFCCNRWDGRGGVKVLRAAAWRRGRRAEVAAQRIDGKKLAPSLHDKPMGTHIPCLMVFFLKHVHH